MVKSVKPPINTRRMPTVNKSGGLLSKVEPTHVIQAVDSATGMFKSIADYGAESQRTERARIEAETKRLEIKADVLKHGIDFEEKKQILENERKRDEDGHIRDLRRIDNRHDLAMKNESERSRLLDMLERGEITAEECRTLLDSRDFTSHTDTDNH
ncbi:hypothetical protein R8871_06354 [Paraburkholderia graminis C4D1M]|uniref:Uncharacterized protein n=1 Tax=Paraburkholderia graminis (strain ATCC 700544 / DSM 17151 / LMG 18924 / NCIMB 13744 / C4D1M) TaxID=396598 RepID=B1GB65_PARG4|nr:hypothetical protein [Paraburkholderia graminis]EDT06626.1 hypothetical protein BgramDRAFT_6599 [Paraburkholderia graminis C4D1M]CAB3737723.1 hypothetical protein R8871_06354 [Paraburkholderia graminis C4D1M]